MAIELTQDHLDMINETRDTVRDIQLVLKGYNGHPGLCADHENLKRDYYKFKRLVLCVVAFLVGSGALGFGVTKIVQAFI